MTETTSVTGAFTRGEGKDATFEVGKFAPLAGGSITARIGDTHRCTIGASSPPPWQHCAARARFGAASPQLASQPPSSQRRGVNAGAPAPPPAQRVHAPPPHAEL